MRALLIVLGPAALWLVLAYRLTRFRKDRQGLGSAVRGRLSGFGLPHDLYSRENYTEEGQRLIPWLWAALVLLVVSGILVMGLIARG